MHLKNFSLLSFFPGTEVDDDAECRKCPPLSATETARDPLRTCERAPRAPFSCQKAPDPTHFSRFGFWPTVLSSISKKNVSKV